MSDQSEFEEWFSKYGRRNVVSKMDSKAIWKACAKSKDKDYQEMVLEYADYKIQATKEIAALQNEIAYLRHFGNEACTAKADEAIKRGTWRIHEKTGETE